MSAKPEDPIKHAESVGYSRGYAAGRRRLEADDHKLERDRRREEFRNQAFLAALPGCVVAQNWHDGKKEPITTLPSRVKLAWSFADSALKGATFS